MRSPLDEDISTPNAAVRVLVIHAQEDRMIALVPESLVPDGESCAAVNLLDLL